MSMPYLGEKTPPWPIAQFQICLTVALNDLDSTLLLQNFLVISGVEKRKDNVSRQIHEDGTLSFKIVFMSHQYEITNSSMIT